MLLGGTCARPFPLYFVKYLQPVVLFFLSLLSYCTLFMQLWDLRDVVHFIRTGGDGDRDMEGEEERRLCLLYFYFCLRRTILGAGTSLSVVVAAFALSLEIPDWYYGADLFCNNCWSLVIL